MKIEFLGYVITHNKALSPRHTEAINEFKQPANVHEVQCFLGLTSYFRRFIKDFSLKARPLQNLLRKDTTFCFDEKCMKSFNLLNEELVILTRCSRYTTRFWKPNYIQTHVVRA